MLPQRPNFDLFEATLEVAVNSTSQPTFKKWEALVQSSPVEALIKPALFCINPQEDPFRDKTRVTTCKVPAHPLMLMLSTWELDLIPQGLTTIFKTHDVGNNPDLGQGLEWVWKNSKVSLERVQKYQEEKHGYEEAWIRMARWVEGIQTLDDTIQKEDLNFWTCLLARAHTLATHMAYPSGLESKYPNKTGKETLQDFEVSIRQSYCCLFEQQISFEGLHRLYAGELEGMKPSKHQSETVERKERFLFELRWMIEESRGFPEVQTALFEELNHPSILRALDKNPNAETWHEMMAPLKLQAAIPQAKIKSKSKARM